MTADATPEPNFDEAAVKEGCVCGHGQYNHGWTGVVGRILGMRSNCDRCSCPEFRRG